MGAAHFDHTDGNEWLHASGAVILAHTNTRKWMSAQTRVEKWNFTFPKSPDGELPTMHLGGGASGAGSPLTFHLNGTSVVVTPFAPAHTDGDLSAHFLEPDILRVGDIWWNGYYRKAWLASRPGLSRYRHAHARGRAMHKQQREWSGNGPIRQYCEYWHTQPQGESPEALPSDGDGKGEGDWSGRAPDRFSIDTALPHCTLGSGCRRPARSHPSAHPK